MRQDELETVRNGTGIVQLPRAGYQHGGSSERAGGDDLPALIDGEERGEHAGRRGGPAPSSPRGSELLRAPVRQYMPSFFGARQSPAIGNIVTAAYSLYLLIHILLSYAFIRAI